MFNNTIKKILSRKLEIWKEEQRVQALKEEAEYKDVRNKEIVELAELCANDTKKLEHSYHRNQEILGIAIAKLEAKKEVLETIVGQDKATYNLIVTDKNKEIARLNTIILEMVKKQPASVTVNANK